jgi:hypothetical protein
MTKEAKIYTNRKQKQQLIEGHTEVFGELSSTYGHFRKMADLPTLSTSAPRKSAIPGRQQLPFFREINDLA